MAKPRNQQIDLAHTPYYHCVSRCVRRAFLCGQDEQTGKSYDHRRGWIEQRLLFLGQVFAIDICAYAVMSNHCHVVLYVDQEKVKSWSMTEVIQRWHQVFRGTLLTQDYIKGQTLHPSVMPTLHNTVNVYRQHLMDISWFMRLLNEPIARMANKEDQCTGHFWESRFKSQALLDEKALAACMAYVDLNPIRANMAATPESSAHTSVCLRIKSLEQQSIDNKKSSTRGKTTNSQPPQPTTLAKFVGNPRKEMPTGLPFALSDYLQLVELTGRCINANKRGFIDNKLPNILQRLSISAQHWLTLTTSFEHTFKGPAGEPQSLTDYYQKDTNIDNPEKVKRRPNISQSEKLFAC